MWNDPKARARHFAKEMSKPWQPFIQMDLEQSRLRGVCVPAGVTRAYQNNRYLVQVHDNRMTSHGPAILAHIMRLDGQPVHNWPELQRVKNEVFGNHATAIEYYPPAREVIDVCNIYWLWIYPDGVIPKPKL